VLIDDLSVGCPVYKYVDDSTLSEVLQPKSSDSDMYAFYRAMHFSAKRGIAIACRLSVRLSVCDVGEL